MMPLVYRYGRKAEMRHDTGMMSKNSNPGCNFAECVGDTAYAKPLEHCSFGRMCKLNIIIMYYLIIILKLSNQRPQPRAPRGRKRSCYQPASRAAIDSLTPNLVG